MFPEIERLEKIRKELGYSRREVAGITGIPYESYNNWVNRGHEPNYKNMKKLTEGTRKLVKRLKAKKSKEKFESFFREINKLAATPIGIIEEVVEDIEGKVEVHDMREKREKVKEN